MALFEADVSVIIPAFNAEAFLAEAVKSVLKQSVCPLEIIVINDGSTDATASIAESFGGIVHCISQANCGIATARNNGVLASKGDMVAFLDSDDLWTEDKLEKQLSYMRKDASLDGVFGHMGCFASFDAKSDTVSRFVIPDKPMPGYHAGTMLIKRSAFDRTGEFDATLATGEFIDWYARAIHGGVTFGLIVDVVMHRRIHGANTMIKSSASLHSDYLRIVKRNLDRIRGARLKP